ncbi:MFS transporter [Gemmiger formicilis]|uniref:MFS transporter n=1 Tax=Gemmiger formicilis TaxID=745368 RepID=UPI001956FD53|nr:MFS transporter [Gemmiger formicilis]MBM6914850.1 MFS transporter [Gemmiger formicilis]HIX33818.1 MFS transporter [Candidatus Gemmiger avium]
MTETRWNYNHTLYASYLGYVCQAIVNNLAPLLFLTLQRTYGISLGQITLLVTFNFGVQLLVDLASTLFVDRLGYRRCAVIAHVCCALGLAGLAVLPELLPHPYVGLLAAVCLYAVGGGLIEVLISPIVEACPTEKKDAAMSLLHSFYCWGCVLVIALSTAFLALLGSDSWRMLPLLWALVPAANAMLFSRVPVNSLTPEGGGMSVRELLRSSGFWLLALLMVCAGASELSMSQWASAFAEKGLGISKTLGDLAGPCFFAVLMGLARVLYAAFSDRISLLGFMRGSCVLCVASYLLAVFAPHPALALLGCGLCGLSVGILWPGVFSIAAGRMPAGGTALFALLALGGDLGCSSGPTLVGFVSERAGGVLQAGLLAAILFPLVLLAGSFWLRRILPERH